MKLKELRKSKQLTQQDASNICNVPLRTYKRLENDMAYEKSAKYFFAYSKLEKYEKALMAKQILLNPIVTVRLKFLLMI